MDRGIRLDKTMSIAVNKGLLNAPGENNCFLNSAVQVLWHLDAFRRSFRQLSGHFCMGESCIFCALKVIFTQFQYSDEPVLPPDALRTAMAFAFKTHQRFQLGDMDDAAECFENILSQLHFHTAMFEPSDGCNAKHCISHRKFAMQVLEQTICKCGATSEPLPFFQLVHYVSASALSNEAKTRAGPSFPSFGELLKIAGGLGDTRDCPSNCGETIEIQRLLLNFPDIVSIGLSWDSECPETELINDVLQCLDTKLFLPDVFNKVTDEKAEYSTLTLVGIVTYYGKHYSTFFYHTRLLNWYYYDDACVKEVGPHWEDLIDRCRRSKYQPLLMLYANLDAGVIDITDAPKEVKLVNGILQKSKKSSEKKAYREGASSQLKSSSQGKSGYQEDSQATKDTDVAKSSSLVDTESEVLINIIPTTSGYSAKDKESQSHLKRFGAALKNGINHIKRPASTSPTFRKKALHGSKSGENIRNGPEVVSDGVDNVDGTSSPDNLIDLRAQTNSKNRFEDIMKLYESDLKDANRVGTTWSETPKNEPPRNEPLRNEPPRNEPSRHEPSRQDYRVEFKGDNLIDLTDKRYKLGITRGETASNKCQKLLDEAEDILVQSTEMEHSGDLHTAMCLCSSAATRFRVIADLPDATTSTRNYAQTKRNTCLVRSRFLHSRLKSQEQGGSVSNSSSNDSLDSYLSSPVHKSAPEYVEQLVQQQKQRDAKLLQEQSTSRPMQYGTLPNRFERTPPDTQQWQQPMMQENINARQYQTNTNNTNLFPTDSSHFSTLPNPRKTPNYKSRSVVKTTPICNQQIKPDKLCYNPVHYNHVNGLTHDMNNLHIRLAQNTQPILNTGGQDNLLHTNRTFLRSQSQDAVSANHAGNMQPGAPNNTGVIQARHIVESPNKYNQQYQPTSALPPNYTNPPPYRPQYTQMNTPNHQVMSQNYYEQNRYYNSLTSQQTSCSSPAVVPHSVNLSDDYFKGKRACPRCGIIPLERSQSYCMMCQRGVDRQRSLSP